MIWPRVRAPPFDFRKVLNIVVLAFMPCANIAVSKTYILLFNRVVTNSADFGEASEMDPVIEVGPNGFYLSLKASDPILAKGESR
jgi:hypothetical protein